ncbi:MAG: deoxyribose-phosphate aldolase, partial [Solobacterium sp.]|nr:deoxyribose-phosphate aldolase [Solobacterium sp.]
MKPAKKASEMSVKELASYIDYSVLKPEFTEEEIIELTKDGVQLGCATICINPAYMDLCEPYVKGTDTKLCPVTDFPFGDSSTESRVQQIQIVGKYDVTGEIDIVANFGKLRSGKYDEVTADLKACADAAHALGHELKVILETDALNEEQIRRGCECIIAAGADFIKTSTGFLTGHEAKGSAVEVIEMIMDQNKGRTKIKGSGCI